jgi:anti-sigma B factor antagonist
MGAGLVVRTGGTADYVTVAAAGDVDLESAPALTSELKRVLGPRPVLLDLSGVEFMDSSGLGVLIGAHKEAAALGGVLILVGPVPRVRKIFKITKLNKIFTIHETPAEALAALGDPLDIEAAPVETVVPGFDANHPA